MKWYRINKTDRMKKSKNESLQRKKAEKMTLGDFMNQYSIASMRKIMQSAFMSYKAVEEKKLPSHKVVKI